MDNPGRLFDQIAAEAEISPNKAKVAVYLLGLARQGRSIQYAASGLHRSPETIKEFAREFMIDFPDYRPFERRKERPEPKIRLALS